MTTGYNTARDYLLVALASINQQDGVKALAALRSAVKQNGCSELVAELESLSRTEFELASEELARRTDNADGTDANYPHMPEGYDHSKEALNNPEDITKGNSLDNYPSVKVDFLMDGKVGGDSGNYQGPEISNTKLAYPGVDGNGNEDRDASDVDTAVKSIPEPPVMHSPLPGEPKPGSAGAAKGPVSIVESETKEGEGPEDIGEMFANNDSDRTGIREPEMTRQTPVATSSTQLQADPDKVSKQDDLMNTGHPLTKEKFGGAPPAEPGDLEAGASYRSDGTGEGRPADTYRYGIDGPENNDFSMDDFTAANADLLEDLEDIDDDLDEDDEDDLILNSPDEDWTVFDLSPEERANFAVDLMHSHQYPVESAEDYPAAIWDRGEESTGKTETAETDGNGSGLSTMSDEEASVKADLAFVDKIIADTDTGGEEDSLDVAPPVIASDQNPGDRMPGQFWYQHASVVDPTYHLLQGQQHLAELNSYRKQFANAKIEGNVAKVQEYRKLMNKASRWYNLHNNRHQELLGEAGLERARRNRALRNRERL